MSGSSESVLKNAGLAAWRLAADRLLAPVFAGELVYWRAEQLYREGVTHPDGGDHQEQEEIHAAEGAETACYRLADRIGISKRRLHGDGELQQRAVRRLHASIEADERTALATLDRLGSSRHITLAERPGDYVEASDAEQLLENADRVTDYLAWPERVAKAERS